MYILFVSPGQIWFDVDFPILYLGSNSKNIRWQCMDTRLTSGIEIPAVGKAWENYIYLYF